MGLIGLLAESLGATEPALKLLLTILSGYPLALIYNNFIQNLELIKQHLFFAISGFLLCVFNYGFDVYHSTIAILITYAMCRYLHNSKYLSGINFCFHMSYLLIGYYLTESNEYDIKWTMPHCVLVLRLIGFGFDISDGHQIRIEELSKEQKLSALNEMPSLLKLTAFAYFPAGFIVGPQFTYRRYNKFVIGEFKQYYMTKFGAGFKRGGIGLFYLAIRQLGATLIPDEFLLSTNFASLSILKKLFSIGIWGKLALYKYIACWLLTEGALICFGLTYVGKTKDGGEDDWSACSNVKLRVFEMATKMEHYVQSFNVNTNHWLAQYVYKRLKFLNNRNISYGSALLFLALWHGFHSGYYMSFFLEYLIITMEKQFYGIWSIIIEPKYSGFLNCIPGKLLIFIVMKLYNFFCLGFCMVPFVFLNYEKWLKIFSTIYYYGYIALALWFLLYFSSLKSIIIKQKIITKKLNATNDKIDNSKTQ